MTDQIDFIVLYREPGIGPDCSMDSLRLACTRPVADLHSDRGGESGEDALKSLSRRYAAALDFHRHHGRLPGAPSAPSMQRRHDPVVHDHVVHDPVVPSRWMQDAIEPELEPETRRPSRVVVCGIVLVAALLMWWLPRTDIPAPEFLESVVVNKRETTLSEAIVLLQGMPAQDVIALPGEPVSHEPGGAHWQYWPSRVRLECAKVIRSAKLAAASAEGLPSPSFRRGGDLLGQRRHAPLSPGCRGVDTVVANT